MTLFARRAADVARCARLALDVALEATVLAVVRAGVAGGAHAVVAFADRGACIAGGEEKKRERGEDGDGLHVPIIRRTGAERRYQPDLSGADYAAAMRRASETASRSGCST